MEPQQIQETKSLVNHGWLLLQDSRILFLLVIYAIGMGLKVIPQQYFRTRLIPLALTVIGTFVGILIFPELGTKKAALVGLAFSAVAVYLNQILMQTFPNNKIIQIIAGEFNFSKNPCEDEKVIILENKVP